MKYIIEVSTNGKTWTPFRNETFDSETKAEQRMIEYDAAANDIRSRTWRKTEDGHTSVNCHYNFRVKLVEETKADAKPPQQPESILQWRGKK